MATIVCYKRLCYETNLKIYKFIDFIVCMFKRRNIWDIYCKIYTGEAINIKFDVLECLNLVFLVYSWKLRLYKVKNIKSG